MDATLMLIIAIMLVPSLVIIIAGRGAGRKGPS